MMETKIENDQMKTDFIKMLVMNLRAQDMYGVYANKPDEKIIEPFIVDKEKRKSIPIIGDPDQKVINRLETFYNTIGLLIEKRTGVMASPVLRLHHEGFGRVVLIAGRLVAVSKFLRDVHRFGFNDLEKLNEEADKLLNEGIGNIEKFPEVVKAN